jgi:hypothetical protein
MRMPDASAVPAPLRLQRREAQPDGPIAVPPSVEEVLRSLKARSAEGGGWGDAQWIDGPREDSISLIGAKL